MPIKRFPYWPRELAGFELSRLAMPFEWGRNDCCLFACDAVLAMTGMDIAGRFRNLYRTSREARRILKRHGGIEGMAREIAACNEIPEVAIAKAQRGDVVLFKSPLWPTLGTVCTDGISVVAPGTFGLSRVPLAVARCAWRIG